jgi:hypothetical protein
MVIEAMHLCVSSYSKPSESKMSLTVNLGRVDGYVLFEQRILLLPASPLLSRLTTT